MRNWALPGPAALVIVVIAIAIISGPAGAQKPAPAPVQDVSTFPHRTAAEERKALHVPPGFEIQLVAAEPDIQKPLNIAFDDRGRLWVTDTVEYPYPAKEGTKPRDTVKILSDFGPDGKARSITTFADGLNIPIGLLPLPSANAALVHSIPDIFLLRDTDGDGRADRARCFMGLRPPRYARHDQRLHLGLRRLDLRLPRLLERLDRAGQGRRPIEMNSGNTYRMRPDGSHAEYFTHGQVNPFGLAFDPLGNLYSCDCHSRPVYQLLRGPGIPASASRTTAWVRAGDGHP